MKVIHSTSLDGRSQLWNMNSNMNSQRPICKQTNIQQSPIQSSQFVKNGHLIYLTNSKNINLRSTNDNTILQVLSGHTKKINKLLILKDHLISCSDDHSIRIWDRETGLTLKILQGHIRPVTHLSICNKNKFIISGSEDETVKLWNLSTGTCIHTFQGHIAPISAIYEVEHPAGTQFETEMLLQTASKDGEMILWKVPLPVEEKPIWDYYNQDVKRDVNPEINHDKMNQSEVSHVDRLELLVEGKVDEQFEAINQPAIKFIGHSEEITCVVMDNDSRIQTGSKDKSIKVWSETGKCVKTIEIGEAVSSIDVDSSSNKISVGLFNGKMIVQDMYLDEMMEFEAHVDSVTSLKWQEFNQFQMFLMNNCIV